MGQGEFNRRCEARSISGNWIILTLNWLRIQEIEHFSMPPPPGTLPLRVDIVSDVVCPWCIIGYKQLQKVLDSLPDHFAVQLHWHPFELNPQMPAEGQDLREHLAEKYGPAAASQSQGTRARLLELGASLGFSFDYFDGMRIVNTFVAHQLLHWAAQQGRQTDLKLALFESFFSLREDVSDTTILLQAVVRVGLDAQEAAAVIADQRFAAIIRQQQQHWREQEVYSVPTFYLQRQYVITGAQEAATFERILQKIYAKGNSIAV